MKKWLESNKIFFEITSLILLATASVIVGWMSLKVSKDQLRMSANQSIIEESINKAEFGKTCVDLMLSTASEFEFQRYSDQEKKEYQSYLYSNLLKELSNPFLHSCDTCLQLWSKAVEEFQVIIDSDMLSLQGIDTIYPKTVHAVMNDIYYIHNKLIRGIDPYMNTVEN